MNDQEQEVWRAYLSMTNTLRKTIVKQLADDAGMPLTYYEILVHLSEAPNRTLRMSALAAAAEGTQSQLSHAVNRLEERGWVRRERCEEDGRGWLAVLTEFGMDALREAAPGHVECVRSALFDALTARQQQQLLHIAKSVLDHAETAHAV